MPWSHTIYANQTTAGYWSAQSVFSDTQLHNCLPGDFAVSVCSLIWQRTSPSGIRSDDNVQCDFSMARINPATPSVGALSDVDKAAAEVPLQAWLTSVAAKMSSDYTALKFVWHDYHDTNTKPGPATRVTALSTVGGGSGQRVPDQVSGTISMTTASRRHWGRQYIPGLFVSDLSTYGLLHSSFFCDAAAAAARTLINALAALTSPIELGVFSKTFSGFLLVSSVSVDNVPDIQRRRRANAASYHKIYTS